MYSVSTNLRCTTALKLVVLLSSTAIASSAAFAQTVSSPFAGTEDTGPRSSATLEYAAPVYEQPSTALSAAPPASRAFGSAQTFIRSAASQLQQLLPPNISLQADQGDATLLTIGAVQSGGASRESGIPEGIDQEQAIELNEEVDEEQVRELGGGRAGRPAIDKWIVHYPVAIQGVPVSEKSDVVAFIGASGDIQHVRKRNLPTSVNATEAAVSADAARAVASADAGSWAADATIEGPALEVFTNPDLSGALTYRIDITSNNLSEPNARRYWISATGDAQVVYWESLIMYTHNGQVTGTIWTDSGRLDRPTASMPFDKTTVRRLGGGGGSAQTNEAGLYSFTTGAGNATLSVRLNDTHECSNVNNAIGGELSDSQAGTPANPIDLNFGAAGLEQLAQSTAFYFTNEACKLAADILDPTDLPSLPTNVNLPGQCNAYWNGSSINFYQAGGNCPNMAYDSVVEHEYGHGVDARKGGIVDGGYSEGFGDAMSILGTRKSCVGHDFFGLDTCLRESSDVILWPPGPGDGVHDQGRRYAGFTYQLIEELKNTYSVDGAFAIATQLVMAAALANPADIPDAVMLSFIADDDDGDLTNGTPHFKQLAAAADSRNIPRPADPPISGARRMGFAWAHNTTSASYTPSLTYSYNSAGGAITATRSGTGRYAITFAGLGGQGQAGGNVQVTSYGSTADHCKVYWWSSGGADFRANVRCFTPTGALVNSRYTVIVHW